MVWLTIIQNECVMSWLLKWDKETTDKFECYKEVITLQYLLFSLNKFKALQCLSFGRFIRMTTIKKYSKKIWWTFYFYIHVYYFWDHDIIPYTWNNSILCTFSLYLSRDEWKKYSRVTIIIIILSTKRRWYAKSESFFLFVRRSDENLAYLFLGFSILAQFHRSILMKCFSCLF